MSQISSCAVHPHLELKGRDMFETQYKHLLIWMNCETKTFEALSISTKELEMLNCTNGIEIGLTGRKCEKLLISLDK